MSSLTARSNSTGAFTIVSGYSIPRTIPTRFPLTAAIETRGTDSGAVKRNTFTRLTGTDSMAADSAISTVAGKIPGDFSSDHPKFLCKTKGTDHKHEHRQCYGLKHGIPLPPYQWGEWDCDDPIVTQVTNSQNNRFQSAETISACQFLIKQPFNKKTGQAGN